MRGNRSAALIVAASAVVCFGRGARADSVANYGVFGNANVSFTSFTTIYGSGGSNADMDDAGPLTAGSLYAVGSFNGTSAPQSISGASVFDEDFNGGGLSSYGSIDASGNVELQGNVTYSVTAGQNLSTSDFVNIGGSALAGGNANLSAVDTIDETLGADGNITSTGGITAHTIIYGGTLNLGGGSSYASATQGTVLVQPMRFSALPFYQTAFTSGGPTESLATFANATLAPGHYGALMFQGSNTLNLSSGNYYFGSIQSLGLFTTINYNLTDGPINIFVAGNVDLLAMGFEINGQTLSSLGTADESLASEIYLESHGNVTFDNVVPANGSQFFGTIYAPDGTIATGVNETFYGGLIGQFVDIDSATVYSEPSTYLQSLPEPSAIAVLIAGPIALALRRRR
jgi:hypothetical protein